MEPKNIIKYLYRAHIKSGIIFNLADDDVIEASNQRRLVFPIDRVNNKIKAQFKLNRKLNRKLRGQHE